MSQEKEIFYLRDRLANFNRNSSHTVEAPEKYKLELLSNLNQADPKVALLQVSNYSMSLLDDIAKGTTDKDQIKLAKKIIEFYETEYFSNGTLEPALTEFYFEMGDLNPDWIDKRILRIILLSMSHY